MKKLRVWWIPQIPMKPFIKEVKLLSEAVLILEVLADYDKFQFDNNIKPDYSNAGGLEVYEDDGKGGMEWCEWESENGEDIYEYRYEQENNNLPLDL